MTNPTPNRPPLWLLMEAAYHKRRDPGLSERHDYAAEIRAIAMAIPSEVFGAAGVRLWLLEESNRAERGDD